MGLTPKWGRVQIGPARPLVNAGGMSLMYIEQVRPRAGRRGKVVVGMARRKLWRIRAGPLLVVLLASCAAARAAEPVPPVPAVPRAADVLTLDGRTQTDADPVVANVDGHPIRLTELGKASDTLPDNLRAMPFESLYPALLERMIDHQALVMMARRQGLDENPDIKRDIDAAVERVLEAAYLRREALSKVTDQAIQARYAKEFGNRPATEEVRARHILLPTEAEANDVLAELKKGADFATVAQTRSKDPDGKRGGDLGFFRREQVWPSFADVAFSLQPGQVGPKPVHNEFGWHVIKVEERRLIAPPNLSDVRESIRQELTAQAVRQAVKQARAQLPIHQFNLDGTVKLDDAPRPAGDSAGGTP
jgi:peptidyl-prolyl cis-trans isomerase C